MRLHSHKYSFCKFKENCNCVWVEGLIKQQIWTFCYKQWIIIAVKKCSETGLVQFPWYHEGFWYKHKHMISHKDISSWGESWFWSYSFESSWHKNKMWYFLEHMSECWTDLVHCCAQPQLLLIWLQRTSEDSSHIHSQERLKPCICLQDTKITISSKDSIF